MDGVTVSSAPPAASATTGQPVACASTAVSPDGRLLAAVGEKGTVVLFEVESGEVLQQLEGHSADVEDVVFHPAGEWLATGGDDRQIIRWSVPAAGAPAEQLQVWEAPGQVRSLAVSPDGTLLESGGTDNDISLWKAATGELGRRLEGHTETIASSGGLAFSPSGERLASASYDDTARLWDVATGTSLRVLSGHNGDVQGVTFTPDGRHMATSSTDRRVVLCHQTRNSKLGIACGMDHHIDAQKIYACESECEGDLGRVFFSVEAEPEQPIRLVKYMA